MKTWKDIYKLPFRFKSDWEEKVGRVVDAKGQLIFQFIEKSSFVKSMLLSNIIGIDKFGFNWKFNYNPENQHVSYIKDNKEVNIILIRGWGNLIGIGGYNLAPEEAANIQDTLGEYIVEKLNMKNHEKEKK